MSDLLKMGGLWLNKDKNGNEYFSGDFTNGTKILIYKNTFKEKENQPDFQYYLSAKQKKDEVLKKPEASDIPF